MAKKRFGDFNYQYETYVEGYEDAKKGEKENYERALDALKEEKKEQDLRNKYSDKESEWRRESEGYLLKMFIDGDEGLNPKDIDLSQFGLRANPTWDGSNWYVDFIITDTPNVPSLFKKIQSVCMNKSISIDVDTDGEEQGYKEEAKICLLIERELASANYADLAKVDFKKYEQWISDLIKAHK